jgi:hypothetical protein
MLGVIFFGLVFGAALAHPRAREADDRLLEALNDVVIGSSTSHAHRPFGVFALIFGWPPDSASTCSSPLPRS